jgi:hypothetical protein
MGSDAIHSGILDADLLAQERAFLPQALILRHQPNAAANMAGSHSAGMDDREMGEGDRMQDC